MGSRKLRNQLRRGQCPGARQLLPRPAPRRRRWTEAGDGWVLPQALRTLSGREPRAPAGPANRRPPGRGRRGSSQAPGRVARGRPGQPPPQRAPPPPPRSPRRGEGAGAAGARNGPAAPSAARERRELEGAGRRGRRTCARRAWVWVRGAGAAGARGRGTPATLDSASPAAEVSAPRTMVSGGRRSLFLSLRDQRAGREGAERAAARELRVRPLEPVAAGGSGRAAWAWGGGGERLGAGLSGRTGARGSRALGPSRRSRRAPRGAGSRPAPCCMHEAGRHRDARQTARSSRRGHCRPPACLPQPRSPHSLPPAAPRSPRAGPTPPREILAVGL